jgi:hypothetical protein
MKQGVHCIFVKEQFLPLFEQIVSQPQYQVMDIRRLAVDHCARKIDFMRLLVRKEKLKATSKLDSDRFGGDRGGGHGVSKLCPNWT